MTETASHVMGRDGCSRQKPSSRTSDPPIGSPVRRAARQARTSIAKFRAYSEAQKTQNDPMIAHEIVASPADTATAV